MALPAASLWIDADGSRVRHAWRRGFECRNAPIRHQEKGKSVTIDRKPPGSRLFRRIVSAHYAAVGVLRTLEVG